ncbi:hypothetical protein NESM_000669900 [Novymonas esmeraldas]|uniref:Uncharacterized protein n=1 Tax=Novymonas esmeraldas TaxID=1808958 RepID=A0AAW0EUZ6_9TRYP
MLFDSDDDLPAVPTTESPPTTTSAAQAQRLQLLEAEYRSARADAPSGRHRSARRRTSSSPRKAAETAPSVWEERDEAAFYELRSLVPHLSPRFACSYSDAVLLIAAIHEGGAAAGNRQTIADRCQTLEAERRQLEQRLERTRAQCEDLKNEAAQAAQRLKAAQAESKASVGALAQRREEMRRQFLQEETRAQKLTARNKVLELENESLKERLRGQGR